MDWRLTSISDTEEGFLRLSEALKEIDACLENKIEKNTEKYFDNRGYCY